MKNCNSCKFSNYNTEQLKYYSENSKIPIDWLPYKYCSKIRTYTPKNAVCTDFKPKTEQSNDKNNT